MAERIDVNDDLIEELLDKDKARQRAEQLHSSILATREKLKELEEVYDFFRRRAGINPTTKTRAGSTASAVIEILKNSGRPMKTKDVLLVLGPGANRETVAWVLWDASKRGLIKKVSPGTFAALDYEPAANGSGRKA